MTRKARVGGLVAAFALAMFASVGPRAAMPAMADSGNHNSSTVPPDPKGHAGVAWARAVKGSKSTAGTSSASTFKASYTHTPAPNSGNDLPPGSGPIMPSTTLYYVFWLPTGLHFESNSAGDTNYENLLIRWAQDVGSTQYHNLVTQYGGTNGTTGNAVSYGGSWIDTGAYPHAGTIADPLQDSDIRAEVQNAVATNTTWTEDLSHMVAVFTATGIQECASFGCTSSSTNGFCAYHDHFSDSGNDAVYAFMGFDNFVHVAGKTCVAGQTSGDTDPNAGVYPNGDVSADAEINTLSHEVIEAETDPHPNATWTGTLGEIGDACNFTFTPRNDIGADVYLNGHPYIVQEEWSNAVHTCAIDLPTNGYCSGSVSSVCAPTVSFAKSVNDATPKVTRPIAYTITLNNTSDSGTATNLTFTDTVPAGYTVTGASAPSSTSLSSTSTSVTVAYDYVAVHQSRTISITASVPLQAGIAAINCGSLALQDLLQNSLSTQTTSPCATTTPVKIPTTLTYLGVIQGDFNDSATLTARLRDDTATGINNETVSFSLNATETCAGTTDSTGTAFCSVTPSEAAGPYTVSASFAGDSQYEASSASATFTVLLEESSLASSTSLQLIQQGGVANLTSTLTDPDGGAPISGKLVTMTLGSGAGSQSCSATTNGSGVAACSINPVTVQVGPQPITDSFAGDGFYVAATNTQSALLYAFPKGGDFAIGDQTASGSVTYWGSQWSTVNSLSGGSAPSSFKGFENGILTPTCGSTIWATVGGNSPPPPATVPAYMGVIVTSSVKKTGNTISGNIVHIVIVHTNAGYAPDPAVPGTGTVVATVC